MTVCTQTDRRAGRDFTWSQGLAKAREIRLARRRLVATLVPQKSSMSHAPFYLSKKTRERVEGKGTEATWTTNKTQVEIHKQIHPEIIHSS